LAVPPLWITTCTLRGSPRPPAMENLGRTHLPYGAIHNDRINIVLAFGNHYDKSPLSWKFKVSALNMLQSCKIRFRDIIILRRVARRSTYVSGRKSCPGYIGEIKCTFSVWNSSTVYFWISSCHFFILKLRNRIFVCLFLFMLFLVKTYVQSTRWTSTISFYVGWNWIFDKFD
jgi:hypothetical protein